MLPKLDEHERQKLGNCCLEIDFGYIWIVEDAGDKHLFMKTFQQRLIDRSKHDWCAKIAVSDE